MQDELRQKAQKALDKSASFGEEIDFNSFNAKEKVHLYLDNLVDLPDEEKKDMLIAGVDVSEKERTGTFIQEDNSVIHASALQDGLEVLNIGEALEKYDWHQKNQ